MSSVIHPDIFGRAADRRVATAEAHPSERTVAFRWIALAMLTGILVRLPHINGYVHPDESEFAYVARWWARGAALYKDVTVDRPQLLLLTFRFLNLFTVFSPIPARILVCVWGAGLTVAVAFLVRRVGGSWRAAAAAAILFGWFSSQPLFEGQFANGELLASLPATFCIALGAHAVRHGRSRHLVLAGFFGGCAILYKQSAIDASAALGLWLLFRRDPQWSLRHRTRAIGALLGGLGISIGIAALHGVALGFDNWTYAMFGSRFDQNQANGFSTLVSRLAGSLMLYLPGLIGLVFATTFAAVLLRPKNGVERSSERSLLWIWVVMAMCAFLSGGSYWSHYYLALMPPACALAGLGFDVLCNRRRFVMVWIVAGLSVVAPVVFGPSLLEAEPKQKYLDRLAVAAYVREHVPLREHIVTLRSGNTARSFADRLVVDMYFSSIHDVLIPERVPRVAEYLDRPDGVNYIILKDLAAWPVGSEPVSAALRRHYRQVFKAGDMEVFRRER